MKRTRKWSFVEQEAKRLAGLRLSPLEIARRLGVNKSSVTRWMKAGKLQTTGDAAPSTSRRASGRVLTSASDTPAQWAAAVRKDYQLDSTDEQLVNLAESALLSAKDPHASWALRLQSMGRFQALVKQLGLTARAGHGAGTPAAPEETPPARRVNPPVTRSAGDPRALLAFPK